MYVGFVFTKSTALKENNLYTIFRNRKFRLIDSFSIIRGTPRMMFPREFMPRRDFLGLQNHAVHKFLYVIHCR